MGERCTVVVVDDAVEVRHLVTRALMLSDRFEVVAEGASGIDAVELARQYAPTFLLLDVSMPEMDGLEALPRLRAAAPATLVVMYTGFEETGVAASARALGAAALIEKSTPIEQLADRLEQIRHEAGQGMPVAAAVRDAQHAASDDTADSTRAVLDDHVERFREVFDDATIGMATLTLTGTVVRANAALGELIRHPPAELVGRQYADVATEQGGAERIVRGLHEAQEGTGRIVQFEHPTGGSVGSWRRLLATAAPVADANGRPLYLFMQVQDVTAQRRAEEELRQSEERFRLLVERVQDYAIFMLDTTGHVVSWNAGAQRIKGYSSEEIIGRHFGTFYPPEVQASGHPQNELALALRDGHYEEEGWRIRKDGSSFWASVVITAVHNRDGKHIGFAKVTRDIDERRRMQLDLEQSAAALATANESLGAANTRLAREAADQAQFLAVTAHELRSPITVLTGSASLLVQHWSEMDDADRAELFESVQLSAGRLQRLLSDLLTASRLGSRTVAPRSQEVDVSDVLARAIAAVHAATPDAEIRLAPVPHVRVMAEPDPLAQALDNLLGNALRHGRPPVDIEVHEVDGRVEIRVRDAGPGIAPELRERLFERFSSGSGGGGTGLGLFIVRELVRAYGGDAWYVPPREGPGYFVVSLLAPGAAPPEPDLEVPVP